MASRLSREEALLSVLDDNQSELSSLSSDDDDEDYAVRDNDYLANQDIVESDDQSDEANESNEDEESTSEEHAYRWRKRDIMYNPGAFEKELEDVPEDMTHLSTLNCFGLMNSLILL